MCNGKSTHIDDYIVSATEKWMDDPSEQNMTFKEAVAMITGASVTLFEHIDMITGQLHQPLDPDGESVAPETIPIKPAQGVPYSADVKSMGNVEEALTNLTNRIDQLESKFLSILNTKQLIEEEMLCFKQSRENFESELVLKIETLGKLSCAQDDKIIDLMKEIKNLKEKESATNKQIEKLTHDTKENEKIFLKIDQELQRNADKMENITKDVKNQSKLITTLQEEHLKNAEHSATTLKSIGSKYGVMCKILQKRLAPVEKLMLNANQTTVKNEPNLQMVESSDKSLNVRLDKTCEYGFNYS
ncbi:uncharacterized protein LOC131943383 [Physella acuta]|uniref:uncharacterized protein LOC131943383 n=1 Tax=Physella acuta TaxID=109671 RepID=UPI0027DD282B|nr:uncharacterized protein LOC131943383 [Physella acuta]